MVWKGLLWGKLHHAGAVGGEKQSLIVVEKDEDNGKRVRKGNG